MESKTRKEITKYIIDFEVIDPASEDIETLAIRYPDEYTTEEEYIDFQLEIAKMVEEINQG